MKMLLNDLKKYGSKIYRTDKMGEITITVDKNGKMKIDKCINIPK
jgi:beta-lactamase superfamily II metal-dependent hydrolase